MSTRLSALTQRALSTPETSEWHVTVMKALGADLANKVSRITLISGRITAFTESSAWAPRLRFRLAECESELRSTLPGVTDFLVRVRPR
jgi:hypothetical protein